MHCHQDWAHLKARCSPCRGPDRVELHQLHSVTYPLGYVMLCNLCSFTQWSGSFQCLLKDSVNFLQNAVALMHGLEAQLTVRPDSADSGSPGQAMGAWTHDAKTWGFVSRTRTRAGCRSRMQCTASCTVVRRGRVIRHHGACLGHYMHVRPAAELRAAVVAEGTSCDTREHVSDTSASSVPAMLCDVEWGALCSDGDSQLSSWHMRQSAA